jgi:uncharacterized membrane protein YphA (DoxX/SURF4 family)
MSVVTNVKGYLGDCWDAWNYFWFNPTNPATLSAIRVFAGAMLFYTHLVWTFDFRGFFGNDGWLPVDMMSRLKLYTNGDTPRWSWSYFSLDLPPSVLWILHITALIVFFCLMIGFFSRTMAVLAYVAAVSYANRITPGAYFGLDKINCMLAMYLMLGPCGARYSIDRIWRLRRGEPKEVPPSIGANIAIRLIQLHMCIIYLFSALGKLQGDSWWTGEAVWYSSSNYEYQFLVDMTWLANWPKLIALLTHATVYWELTYAALVWPRLTRPWVLLMAVMVHVGIAVAYGMPTFGLVMLIGNCAFISPETVRAIVDPLANRVGGLLGSSKAGRGRGAAAAAAAT